MEQKTEELIHAVVDVFATHNILNWTVGPSDDEALRLVTGGTMTALGYAFGPELEDRFRNLKGTELSDKVKKQAIYAGAGAAMGGIVAYLSGDDLYERRIGKGIVDSLKIENPRAPSGLITLASVGWLGYSMFWREKAKEFKERQTWGLGAGAVGYLTGPKLLQQINTMTIPASVKNDAVESFSRGIATLGAVGGGIGGYLLARNSENESA